MVASEKLAEEAVLHALPFFHRSTEKPSSCHEECSPHSWLGTLDPALKGVEQNLLAENCVCLSNLWGTHEGRTQDVFLSSNMDVTQDRGAKSQWAFLKPMSGWGEAAVAWGQHWQSTHRIEGHVPSRGSWRGDFFGKLGHVKVPVFPGEFWKSHPRPALDHTQKRTRESVLPLAGL